MSFTKHKIEIVYENTENNKFFYTHETELMGQGEAAKEAIDAFYKWANETSSYGMIIALIFTK